MAVFRTYGQIVRSMRDRLKLTQINLDTKEGTVARDLFIDIQSDEISRLYRALSEVSKEQDPSSSSGEGLKRWARNFGITVNPGSPAQGLVVFTTNTLNADESIPSGSLLTSRGGLQFRVIGEHSMNVVDKNVHAATGNRLRASLDLIGNTDQYAIEVAVVAISNGSSGNIGSYQITSHSINGGLNVINLSGLSRGKDSETQDEFRTRIFTRFSGSGTGTSDAYKSVAISVQNVLDAIVVSSGNTLMLRDGTEVINTADGGIRILNSGTGGKVDIYIIGQTLVSYSDSFTFTDRSGGDPLTSIKNNFVPGYAGFDKTLTVDELRLNSFRSGVLPAQPITEILSVTGSKSGVLALKTTDQNGNVFGNYELIKDVSPMTGGSPFSYDAISFISSAKEVQAESLSNSVLNGVSTLKFSEAKDINMVYQDLQITSENATVSKVNKSIITLNHFPVKTVSRVFNVTTGESYAVINQNIDPQSLLNILGQITISGRNLPSQSDTLEVDYTWRVVFDEFTDFNGKRSVMSVQDPSVVDAIDWGVSNGVQYEEALITKTIDGLEFVVDLPNNISRVLSVYSSIVESALTTPATILGVAVQSVVLSGVNPAIENIISIKDDRGVEFYSKSSTSFSGNFIYLAADAPITSGTNLTIIFNKVEFYTLSDGTGTFSTNRITLPSPDTLSGSGILSDITTIQLNGDIIHVDYMINNTEIIPSETISSMPISGDGLSNTFLSSTLTSIANGLQPVMFRYDNFGVNIGAKRSSPAMIRVSVSGTTSPGNIKLAGTTLTRMIIDVDAGLSYDGIRLDLTPGVLSALGVSSIPSGMFLARVDSVSDVTLTRVFDLVGGDIQSNEFAIPSVGADAALGSMTIRLPQTGNNSGISFTTGEIIRASVLIGIRSDSETLYFGRDGEVISNKPFGRLDTISVASGFRSQSGTVLGSVSVNTYNQPLSLTPYFADYNFTSPKEGELITVRYNYNATVTDASIAINKSSVITSDVLVKEGFSLPIDVYGEIIVNKNYSGFAQAVIDNVVNAITGTLSTTFAGEIDYSDIISVGAAVPGVDSLNISLFNESGTTGRRTYIKALDNQYLSPGVVSFKAIQRKDFRIS